MEKDRIFFAEKGYTTTSANFIANLCKEWYQTMEMYIRQIRFYEMTIGLIGSRDTSVIQTGVDSEDLKKIPFIIDKVAKAKSLIAWIREAIKARTTLIQEIEKTTFQDWCKMTGKEYPVEPERGHILTEDEYYASLSIKERNAYYTLDTKCSNLGKHIHLNDDLSEARADLKNCANQPARLIGTGRDAIVYRYRPTVSVQEVDEMFYQLQDKYREWEKNLNSIKAECERAIETSRVEVETKYLTEYREYSSKYDILTKEWANWKKDEIVKIQGLKIVIPDSLADFCNEMEQLGKNRNK